MQVHTTFAHARDNLVALRGAFGPKATIVGYTMNDADIEDTPKGIRAVLVYRDGELHDDDADLRCVARPSTHVVVRPLSVPVCVGLVFDRLVQAKVRKVAADEVVLV